jgi:hypothetical protein
MTAFKIYFDQEEQIRQAGSRDPRDGNGSDELKKVVYANYHLGNKPEILECKVENCLHDNSFKVILIPAYCPCLQRSFVPLCVRGFWDDR